MARNIIHRVIYPSALINRHLCLNGILIRNHANNCVNPTDDPPRCSSEKLEKSPCMDKKKEKGSKKELPSIKSMWLNPECCIEKCTDILPRFDDLYYKISDKAKRKYQQTWIECPIRIVQKVICDYEKLELPLPERRPRGKRPPLAKSSGVADGDLMKCLKVGKAQCVKIVMPGCRAAVVSQYCKTFVRPDCQRVCCPYPSYSECKKPALKPARLVECDCLQFPSLCEMKLLLAREAKTK